MIETEKPVAEGKLNKIEGSVIVAVHESVQSYFRTDSAEIIFLSDEASSEVDKHASELMMCIDNHQNAKVIYSLAIEEYGKVYSQPQRAAELSILEAKTAKAEAELNEK